MTDRYGSPWFWAIIDSAHADRAALRGALLHLSKGDIRRFQEEFVECAGELTCEPFMAFVEESEDGLDDVAEWVVSQGRAKYLSVIESPSSIPHSVSGMGRAILSGVAYEVYEELFGEGLDIH